METVRRGMRCTHSPFPVGITENSVASSERFSSTRRQAHEAQRALDDVGVGQEGGDHRFGLASAAHVIQEPFTG